MYKSHIKTISSWVCNPSKTPIWICSALIWSHFSGCLKKNVDLLHVNEEKPVETPNKLLFNQNNHISEGIDRGEVYRKLNSILYLKSQFLSFVILSMESPQ